MSHLRAVILGGTLWSLPVTAALAAAQDAPTALHQRKPAARRASTESSAEPKSSVTPMFEGSDRPDTPAEKAASLEKRRKAFFAAPPADTGASAPSAPDGVTLGGSNGLTPGMGLRF